jgi:hypothetical protein
MTNEPSWLVTAQREAAGLPEWLREPFLTLVHTGEASADFKKQLGRLPALQRAAEAVFASVESDYLPLIRARYGAATRDRRDEMSRTRRSRLHREDQPTTRGVPASRITTTTSFLDLVDILSRGSTEQWRSLYAAAMHDEAVRLDIEAALPLVDIEITNADLIWRDLLAHLRETDRRREESGAEHAPHTSPPETPLRP